MIDQKSMFVEEMISTSGRKYETGLLSEAQVLALQSGVSSCKDGFSPVAASNFVNFSLAGSGLLMGNADLSDIYDSVDIGITGVDELSNIISNVRQIVLLRNNEGKYRYTIYLYGGNTYGTYAQNRVFEFVTKTGEVYTMPISVYGKKWHYLSFNSKSPSVTTIRWTKI